MNTMRSPADRLHALCMEMAAAATFAYWANYFSGGHVRASDDDAYVAFQNAFPLADAYMALCYLVSGRLLRRRNAFAVPAGIAAGSAMTFLAAMDILWNIEHASYQRMTRQMALEATVNLASLVFGPLTMIRLWRLRHRLA